MRSQFLGVALAFKGYCVNEVAKVAAITVVCSDRLGWTHEVVQISMQVPAKVRLPAKIPAFG